MQKFYDLSRTSKDPYFIEAEWLDWIRDKELTIGGFIITGLDKLAREFPEEVYELLEFA